MTFSWFWKTDVPLEHLSACCCHVLITHDDVMKWKHFPRYWPFVRGVHRSPVNSPHKGQWRGALMFSLIGTRLNGWVNNRCAGDLRRHQVHYDVIVTLPDVKAYCHIRMPQSTVKDGLCEITIHRVWFGFRINHDPRSIILLLDLISYNHAKFSQHFNYKAEDSITGAKIMVMAAVQR